MHDRRLLRGLFVLLALFIGATGAWAHGVSGGDAEYLKNIAGVKDATANMMRPTRERAACAKDWRLISGEDGTALGYTAHGGHGCISVTANVAPKLCSQFQEACMQGAFETALALQDKLMPLHQHLFVETNPSPAKYALSILGKIADTVRLPMVPLGEKSKAAVRDAMVHAGLVN